MFRQVKTQDANKAISHKNMSIGFMTRKSSIFEACNFSNAALPILILVRSLENDVLNRLSLQIATTRLTTALQWFSIGAGWLRQCNRNFTQLCLVNKLFSDASLVVIVVVLPDLRKRYAASRSGLEYLENAEGPRYWIRLTPILSYL